MLPRSAISSIGCAKNELLMRHASRRHDRKERAKAVATPYQFLLGSIQHGPSATTIDFSFLASVRVQMLLCASSFSRDTIVIWCVFEILKVNTTKALIGVEMDYFHSKVYAMQLHHIWFDAAFITLPS